MAYPVMFDCLVAQKLDKENMQKFPGNLEFFSLRQSEGVCMCVRIDQFGRNCSN